MRVFLFISLLFSLSCIVESVSGPHKKPTTNFTPYFYCNETKRGTIECVLDGDTKNYVNFDDQVISFSDPDWWIDFMIAALLVCTSGTMSGLTIGLMGLDLTNLEIVRKTGTPQEKRYAKRIIPLLKRHHLLLCTLLLCNALALEALPIFLEHLVSPVAAVIISVTLILFFGEVIPQSLCTRWGLSIGAHMSYFVWFLIIISFPISWPISKILDLAIGKGHGTYFNRAELKELIALHGERLKKVKNDPNSAALPHDVLTYDEVTIIRGALDLKNKTVMRCITPLEQTFMLDTNEIMDSQKLALVSEEAHSRVPVYHGERTHIVGMILTKDLLLLGHDRQAPISSLEIRRLPMVYSTMPLYKVLDIFRGGSSHMAVVIDDKDHTSPIGVITLEDVIEELIQEDIEDEADLRRKKKEKEQGIPEDNAAEDRRKSLDDYEQTDINSVYWAEEEDDDITKIDTNVKRSFFAKGKRFFSKFVY